ncbi:CRISPR-associated DxTHG motif protein [Pyrobaculum aerophilum]|jgi:CRISPR-associated DxTHG motif protein|uniref:CRISPR-associated DxTHG motif protein n=1 Tax=Pyrobaculum aerophilum TaxID=13773 RepID=UPI002FD914EA
MVHVNSMGGPWLIYVRRLECPSDGVLFLVDLTHGINCLPTVNPGTILVATKCGAPLRHQRNAGWQ